MHLLTTHWWMSSPSLGSDQFPASSPSLSVGHDILWWGMSLLPHLQLSCPGFAPSHLVHLCWQGMETWKIPECEYCLAKNKTSLCYQHVLTLNSKHSTVPATRRKWILSQLEAGCDPGGSRLGRVQEVMPGPTLAQLSPLCVMCLWWGESRRNALSKVAAGRELWCSQGCSGSRVTVLTCH